MFHFHRLFVVDDMHKKDTVKRFATIPLHASDDEPLLFDVDAPFDGGLFECGGGDVEIILDDDAAAAATAKDG